MTFSNTVLLYLHTGSYGRGEAPGGETFPVKTLEIGAISTFLSDSVHFQIVKRAPRKALELESCKTHFEVLIGILPSEICENYRHDSNKMKRSRPRLD